MQQISSLTGRLWRFSSYHNQREVRGLNAESTNTSLACINKLSKNHYFPSFEHQIMTHEGNGCFSYDLWLTSARVDSDIIIHGDVKSCLTSLPLIKRSSSHLKCYCIKCLPLPEDTLVSLKCMANVHFRFLIYRETHRKYKQNKRSCSGFRPTECELTADIGSAPLAYAKSPRSAIKNSS